MISRDKFKSIADSFKDKQVLIIGDMMLDRYYYGQTNRMSPEAPVPIVDIDKIIDNPGGSSNVALNISMLGAKPIISGIIGSDTYGKIIQDQLEKNNISTDLIVEDSDRPTTIKSRIISKEHQIIRMDQEDASDHSEDLTNKIITAASEVINDVDGIILQDYNKGLLNGFSIPKFLTLAAENEVPVYVDPKHNNFTSYNNIRLFKPNLSEFLHYDSKFKNLEDAGLAFKSKINSEILMITKGADGVSVFCESDHFQIPTRARKVHDVSGAGDTVISAFCLSDLCGANPQESAFIANYAAGRVCEQPGVVPIQITMLKELLDHLDQ